MQLKKAKESWKANFDKLLASAEKKEYSSANRYYQGEYLKAIKEFTKSRKASGFEGIFKVNDISNIYSNIYINIGV